MSTPTKKSIRQRLAAVQRNIERLARLRDAVSDADILIRTAKRKKKWIQKAIKRPGRLHKHFGISGDKTIPMSKINAEIKKLKAKKKRTKSDTSLLRALNMAKTLKSKKK